MRVIKASYREGFYWRGKSLYFLSQYFEDRNVCTLCLSLLSMMVVVDGVMPLWFKRSMKGCHRSMFRLSNATPCRERASLPFVNWTVLNSFSSVNLLVILC